MARRITKESEGFYKVLPRRLRNLMSEREGTHDDLAAILGVQRQTVTNYCNGISSPSLENLVLIADYFNTSVDYLLGRTEAKQQDRPDLRAICDYTGLSEQAVENLHTESFDKESISAISRFLGTDDLQLHHFAWLLSKSISLYRKNYVERRSSKIVPTFESFFPDELQPMIHDCLESWGGEALNSALAADYYAMRTADIVKDMALEAALGRLAALNVRTKNEYNDIEIFGEK